MESDKRSYYTNLKSVFVIITIAGLVLTGFTLTNANAVDTNLGVGTDLSSKENMGKSDAQEHLSANANVSASMSGSSENSKEKSDENSAMNSSADVESKTESHQNYTMGSSEESKTESHQNYKMSYEKTKADSNNSFETETEHHIYKPGDTVSIEGSIWSNLVTLAGGISTVSIQVTDNTGNVVYAGQEQITNDGDYSTSFQLPSDAKNGAYAINVKGDVSADVLNTLSLKTQSSLQSSSKFVVVSPNAFAVKAAGKDFDVKVATNSSSVSNMKFDEQGKKLSFTVQGDTGTKGVTDITIPKSLLNGDLTVMMDGHAMAQSDVIQTAETNDNVTLELNYHHSTHQIDIVGTNAVPEFSSFVPVILAISMVTIIVFSMKRQIFKIGSL